jgi:hypothetical protein
MVDDARKDFDMCGCDVAAGPAADDFACLEAERIEFVPDRFNLLKRAAQDDRFSIGGLRVFSHLLDNPTAKIGEVAGATKLRKGSVKNILTNLRKWGYLAELQEVTEFALPAQDRYAATPEEAARVATPFEDLPRAEKLALIAADVTAQARQKIEQTKRHNAQDPIAYLAHYGVPLEQRAVPTLEIATKELLSRSTQSIDMMMEYQRRVEEAARRRKEAEEWAEGEAARKLAADLAELERLRTKQSELEDQFIKECMALETLNEWREAMGYRWLTHQEWRSGKANLRVLLALKEGAIRHNGRWYNPDDEGYRAAKKKLNGAE